MASNRRRREPDRSPALLEAALGYAALGIPVFPLYGVNRKRGCRCGNPTCKSVGKHPAVRWGSQASTDPDRLARLLRPSSRSGLGAAVGHGFLVLDFDPRHGGLDSFAEIEREFEAFPCTTKVLTGESEGTRGIHLWMRTLPGIQVKSRPLDGFRGVDVKAQVGYVVLPPTLHRSGVHYETAIPFEEMAAAPDWVLDLVGEDSKDGYEEADGRKLSGLPLSSWRYRKLSKGGVPEGEQRAFLCGSARALIETGKHDYESATQVLMNALDHSNTDPSWEWTEDEVWGIVASIDRSPRPALKRRKAARPKVVGYSGRRSR